MFTKKLEIVKNTVNLPNRTENEKLPSINRIISEDKRCAGKIPTYGGKNKTGLLTEKKRAYSMTGYTFLANNCFKFVTLT